MFKKIIFILILGFMLACSRQDDNTVVDPGTVPAVSPAAIRTPDVSRYEPQVPGVFGWYNLYRNGAPQYNLIISKDNQPVGQLYGDELTVPGFYLSYEKRLDFEQVSVVGQKVHFKTREIDGSWYEFDGTVNQEIFPLVINGALKAIRNGKVVKDQNVNFTRAVID